MNPALKSAHCAVAAIVALGIGIGAYLGLEALRGASQAPDVGHALLDGSRSSTGQLRGKVVLINFGATSRVPCIHEMPQIAAPQEKFRELLTQT